MDITTHIPDEILDEFSGGFLTAAPIYVDKDKNPTMTPKVWLEFCIRKYLRSTYHRGKVIQNNENVVINMEILK